LSKTLITLVAIGNQNVADDGIGLYLLETIQDKLSDDIDVRFWKNKDALSITAELLEIKTPIVIVDCADMGLKGGEFRWFEQSECQLAQQTDIISTHSFGFSDALALAETLGFKQAVFFFAIQPMQLEVKNEISPFLVANKTEYEKSLLTQLEKLKNKLS